jgi:hypothetical protein
VPRVLEVTLCNILKLIPPPLLQRSAARARLASSLAVLSPSQTYAVLVQCMHSPPRRIHAQGVAKSMRSAPREGIDELSDLAKGNATVLQVCLLLWLDIRVPVTRDWIRYSTPSGLGANT